MSLLKQASGLFKKQPPPILWPPWFMSGPKLFKCVSSTHLLVLNLLVCSGAFGWDGIFHFLTSGRRTLGSGRFPLLSVLAAGFFFEGRCTCACTEIDYAISQVAEIMCFRMSWNLRADKALPVSFEICFTLMLHESLVVSKGPVAASLEVSMTSLSSPRFSQDKLRCYETDYEYKSVNFSLSTASFKKKKEKKGARQVSLDHTSFFLLA